MNPVTSNTLLTYSMSTLPDPLQVSPATGTSHGSISIVASNNANDPNLQLSSLTIILPIGTDAASLTNDPGAISYSCSPSSVWSISPGASSGEYVLSPVNGSPVTVTTEGIVIQFNSISVNQVVGTADIEVNELAQGTAKPRQLREAVFAAAKFPYGFYFGNLMASAPMVPDNGTVTLTWVGSTMSTYTVKWDNNSQDVTELRSWTSPALNNTSTFQVIATSVSQGETVNTSQSVTVIVDNPEIDATSLSVSGITNLQGNTTAAGLTVSGASTFQNPATFSNTVTVNNSLTANSGTFGSVQVNNSINASSGSIGTLTAGNSISSPAATFTNTTVNGLLKANNAVNMIGWGGGLSAGSYTALTDGIAVAYATSAGQSYSSKIVGWAVLTTASGTFYAYGGNSDYPGGSYNDSGMLTFPIKSGQGFSFGVLNSKGTISTYYYFIPLGFINPSFSGASAVKTGEEFPVVAASAPNETEDADALAAQLLEAVQQGNATRLADVIKKIMN